MAEQKGLFFNMEDPPKPEVKEKKVGEWDVRSWTSNQIYKVRRDGSRWTCECYFFREKLAKSEGKKKDCKHISQVKESLGLLKEDLSGFKSGIQKALRRGDLPLLRLCFTKLWETEPKWISWRLVILCAEESWKYTGIAGQLSWPEPQRNEIWKLLCNISLAPKNKEAEGLNIYADKITKHNEDPGVLIKDPARMAIFNGWVSIRQSINLLETDPETFWNWFSTGDNEFAGEIVRTARRRSKFGGMSGDKMLLFVAAYLACVTKVDPIELDEAPKEEDVEPMKELPAYVYDMHSGHGKIVYYQFKKMLGEEMGEYVGMELWFNLGSAWCDCMVEDSFWWNLCLEAWAKRRGKTLNECREDFKHWWPKIREKVEKILVARRRNPNPATPQ